jgi:hypothetical protein
MDNFEIKSDNLEKYANKLASIGLPTFRALESYVRRSSEAVAGQARSQAPVNNGALRASINAQYQGNPTGAYVESSIGTNLGYAPYMEFGTGLVHDHPSWGRKRHMVPYRALIPWVKRKFGVNDKQATSFAIAIAKKIMKRGGLLPRRFLRGSLERFETRIKSDAQQIVSAIKRSAGLV